MSFAITTLPIDSHGKEIELESKNHHHTKERYTFPSFPSHATILASTISATSGPSPAEVFLTAAEEETIFGEPCHIAGLTIWLGSHRPALDESWLRAHSISHILDIGSPNPNTVSFITYKKIVIDDSPQAQIHEYFEPCIEFIDTAFLHGTGLYIHCHAGISRSSTILIAWLIRRFFERPGFHASVFSTICPSQTTCDVEHFISFVRLFRPVINPNEGFISQLRLFFMIEQMKALRRRHGISV